MPHNRLPQNLMSIRTQKFRWTAVLIAGLLAAVLINGCKKAESGSDSVAKVNGKKIMRSEVEKYYRNSLTPGAPEPEHEQADSQRLGILRQLIDDEITMQRAEKLSLLATDEEVEAKFSEFKAPYTQEQFEKRLKEKNLTAEDLKRDLRRNLSREKVLNKEITSKITVTDSDVTNYYNTHKSEFNLIEPQYHLAQIVVTTMPGPQSVNLKNSKAQNEPDARRKIQEIVNRLDSGEDFATVAMNYSEQPDTSGNGGDMGFLPESALKSDRAAYEHISKLKPGQYTAVSPYSDPPTSNHVGGFRIIKLLGREPAGQRDLNDPRVQEAIRQQLHERREQLLKAAYYENLRDEAKVENYLAQEIVKDSGHK